SSTIPTPSTPSRPRAPRRACRRSACASVRVVDVGGADAHRHVGLHRVVAGVDAVTVVAVVPRAEVLAALVLHRLVAALGLLRVERAGVVLVGVAGVDVGPELVELVGAVLLIAEVL